ncbi:MAG: peptidase [Alphaproteobacteria bacterium]|nr:MAG: peptidase [Alphaproteobacteria bacterium]
MAKQDIYQIVTNTIIAAIENGQTGDKFVLPWNSFSVLPQNAKTQKQYRGVNVPLLWAWQIERKYQSGVWATYRQWQDMGAQVKKGEKGVQIVFWKSFTAEPCADNQEDETRMFARWSTVFNADQVDNFNLEKLDSEACEIQSIGMADALIDSTDADIRHNEMRAYYNVGQDYINLPSPEEFKGTKTSTATENYYSTLFHELTHWSGAKHRLDRPAHKRYGDTSYAFEELVAELGAAMCCASTGVESSVRADHAQYIDCWLKALKSEKRFIFSASSQAQKAVDYLHSFIKED